MCCECDNTRQHVHDSHEHVSVEGQVARGKEATESTAAAAAMQKGMAAEGVFALSAAPVSKDRGLVVVGVDALVLPVRPAKRDGRQHAG